MKKFLKKIIFHTIISLIIIEVAVRVFSLTNDVPHRKKDKFNLQVFIENQKGISNGHNWKTNEYGFLGHSDLNGGNQLLVIGDSFIENIMNPFNCRQSQLFRNKGFKVFEIGRSGITFIEGLEFYKSYKPIVKPRKTFFFINNSDFIESIKEINSYNDRCQIELKTKKIFKGEIRYKNLKKILYNYKTLYYLYIKFLKSTNKLRQNFNNNIQSTDKQINKNMVEKLIKFSTQNYNLDEIVFVFRKSNFFKKEFKENNLEFLELEIHGDKFIFTNDSHWNCIGHQYANEKIIKYLN